MTVPPLLLRLAAASLACLAAALASAQSPPTMTLPSAASGAPAPLGPVVAGEPADSGKDTPPSPPVASADTKALRAILEGARAEIEQTEAALRRTGLTNDDLQDLRGRLDPITEKLRDELAQFGPKLDAARARLEQLGPKPKEGAPAEGPDVARDRGERETAVADLDEVMRLARALQLQTEQLTSQISDRRRAAFTSALFQRSFGLLDPTLWITVGRSFPRDLRALELLGQDAMNRVVLRSSPFVTTLLGLAIGLGAALHIVRRRLAPRIVHRDALATGISPFRKLLAACEMLVVETVPAAAGSLLIYQAAVHLDVLPGRLVATAGALLGGLALLALLQGLVEALFAPDRPAWRLVEVSDPVAGSIRALGFTVATIVVAGRVMDALNQSIAAGLALSVATKAVFATAAIVALAGLLLRLADRPEREDECLGPYVTPGPSVAGPIRLAGWLLVGGVAAAAIGGYVAFASFLVDQILWVAFIAGLLYLALAACDRFLGGTLKEGSRVSTWLQANLGLRQRSLMQLGVLLSGIARVVLMVAAAFLALAPWGLESADLTTNLRTAFFGFKVGDVTVSLSTTVTALALFLGLVTLTRVVQRWLSDTFLPTTELDSGLRNSIATAAGYLGFFAAAASSFGYLGLSLEKIALVAGALSVGIGFGLQSIVNNFVSGLILLWERPIRVGDLVVVGDGEGFVRRISVRATEIETFDRSTVIVPNSSLISGTVKNRMRSDSTGRVVLPVNVLRNQDPALAAELLIGQAAAHPGVLKAPPPRVVFKKIGDTWLEFDLVCYVDDVTRQQSVQSDLNFSVFKTLVERGILPPLGPGAMNVGGLEPVQAALQQIAGAIASAEWKPAEWTPAGREPAPDPAPQVSQAEAAAPASAPAEPRVVRPRRRA